MTNTSTTTAKWHPHWPANFTVEYQTRDGQWLILSDHRTLHAALAAMNAAAVRLPGHTHRTRHQPSDTLLADVHVPDNLTLDL
jgi:hypothetical protein